MLSMCLLDVIAGFQLLISDESQSSSEALGLKFEVVKEDNIITIERMNTEHRAFTASHVARIAAFVARVENF